MRAWLELRVRGRRQAIHPGGDSCPRGAVNADPRLLGVRGSGPSAASCGTGCAPRCARNCAFRRGSAGQRLGGMNSLLKPDWQSVGFHLPGRILRNAAIHRLQSPVLPDAQKKSTVYGLDRMLSAECSAAQSATCKRSRACGSGPWKHREGRSCSSRRAAIGWSAMVRHCASPALTLPLLRGRGSKHHSTPRRSGRARCSRTAPGSCLSPKPSLPLRWMISKKIGPMTRSG